MSKIVIRGARMINRGVSKYQDVLLDGERIIKVDAHIAVKSHHTEVHADGQWLIPGIIDDQVHFREPGMTYKADIASESRAAIAGGVTSFMEMPNTKPEALTQELLQQKYDIASKNSYANYSFFMGTSNDNYEEVMRTDPKHVCGIKIFMGSSTGNMLVDNPSTLERLFANTPMLIATHCEDEATIRRNLSDFQSKYPNGLTPEMHPLIRNVEACYLSSSLAKDLATKHGTRLHILHISTAKELALFENLLPLTEKRITSEVCVHHLYFSADDYETLGNQIKCNPAIKSAEHKKALFAALLDDRLDIIATDHAPHTWDEKSNPYINAPSGLPLVQHTLNIMMDFHQRGWISMEKVVEKMCHAPAECFRILERGYLDEGMYADLVLIDPHSKWTVHENNVLYKCGWSPLEGKELKGRIDSTYINGVKVYGKDQFFVQGQGKRLTFDR
ncbi:MAG: dihydroorotase [Saprospiraceae bacterium]